MPWEIFGNPPVAWFFIGLFCVISEFFVPGVILVFFGIGAWIAALAAYLMPVSLPFQILIFVIASTVLLISLRKRFNPSLGDNRSDLLDEFIGKTAVVKSPVSKDQPGQVTYRGALWQAETASDQILEKGRRVTIVGQESIMLFVEPKE